MHCGRRRKLRVLKFGYVDEIMMSYSLTLSEIIVKNYKLKIGLSEKEKKRENSLNENLKRC